MEDAKDFAEDNNLAFIETSARESINVDLAFETILIEVYRIGEQNYQVKAVCVRIYGVYGTYP